MLVASRFGGRRGTVGASMPPFGKETLGSKGAGPNGRVGKILIWVPTNGGPAMKNLPKGKGRRSTIRGSRYVRTVSYRTIATVMRDLEQGLNKSKGFETGRDCI